MIAGCGSSGPSVVTVTRPTAGTVAQSGTGTLSGVVVDNQSRAPIAGARLQMNGSVIVTDTNGRFTASALPPGAVQYELSGPQRLTHVSQVNVQGVRENVELDLIADADPFSLGFYRQFARGSFESAALDSTRPWTMAPSFYMRTVTDDTGEIVVPEILAGVRRVITNSVPELSGGRLSVAAFETGTETRAAQAGWVNVTFFNTFPTENAIGDANIGGDIGRIRLAYDPPRRESRIDCNYWVVAVADHEIVHTMGFHHTGAPWGGGSDYDFQSAGCSGTGRTDRTRYHAAVMYSRPRGNSDPDYDPLSYWTLTPDRGPQPIVSCTAADVHR